MKLVATFDEFKSLASIHPIIGVFLLTGFVIGLFRIIHLTLSYGAVLLDCFILPGTNLSKYGAKKGSTAWAVVTGASDGIGKEYAFQLAKKGFNIGLVSRTASKLEALQQEIEQKYQVKAKYIAFDASLDESSNYTALEQFVDELKNVSVLINNVGQSHSMPVPFLETEEKEMRNIITINNIATLKFTQIVVPRIIKAINQGVAKRGLVLTMGSFAGLTPTPLLATYSGSKAFLQSWNNALAKELSPQKVDCQLCISYLVTSAMSKVRKTSVMIPNPKQFAKATLNSVGRRVGAQEREATMTPYWSHALFHWWIENTVGVFSRVVSSINYSMHVDIRKRALRKLAKQQ